MSWIEEKNRVINKNDNDRWIVELFCMIYNISVGNKYDPILYNMTEDEVYRMIWNHWD